MRLRPIPAFTAATVCLALGTGTTFAQRGGFGGGGGGPDPNAIWVMVAKGDVPSINLNERTDIRDSMMRRGTPIPPDGILTKEAFIANFQQRMAQGGGFGGGPPGGMQPGGAPQPGGFGGRPGGGFDPSTMTDDQIRQMMSRYDRNGDGRISAEEAASSDRMKAAFAQFDKNGDGTLDPAEYRFYMQERMAGRVGDPNAQNASIPAQGQPAPNQPGPPPIPQGGYMQQPQTDRRGRGNEEEPEERPTVIRFGKLPKEIPSWFEKLDTDQDGQVGLYEWRQAERVTSEFAEMDQNGDGYLTADEWVRHTRAMLEKKPGDEDSASTGTEEGGRGSMGRGGPGSSRMGRGGPGGDRGQGNGKNPWGGNSQSGGDRRGGR